LRTACLAQRRHEMRALTESFIHGDDKTVENAVQAAHSLSSVSDCADIVMLKSPVRPPSDPAVRAKVELTRAKLAKAKALTNESRYKTAQPIAMEVAEEAKKLAYHPLEAETLYLLGVIQAARLDAKSARRTLSDAVLAAEAGRHDEYIARAWAALVENK